MRNTKKWVRILLSLIVVSMFVTGCTGGVIPKESDNTNTEAPTGSKPGTPTQGEENVENNPKTYANLWTYKSDGGITVREVTVDSGRGGDAVEIVQLTDLHLNLCDDQDRADTNPALISTMANRKWLQNGASIPKIERCLEYAKNADQIVLTGDILDYLTHGALEWVKEHIFDAYADNLMVTPGNHDATRKVQGTVDDPTALESRLEILESYWPNDIHYSSKVLGEKVMVIQMDNASRDSKSGEYFWDEQIGPFRADLAKARENGYVVLLFYHIPIATQNPEYNVVMSSLKGDGAVGSCNFFSSGANSASAHPATKEIYNLIVNNGDIIKGTFCGHHHSDFYTEIKAKTADGTDTVIPQYCLMGVPYGSGNVLKITVT